MATAGDKKGFLDWVVKAAKRVWRFLTALAERWIPLGAGALLIFYAERDMGRGDGHPHPLVEFAHMFARELGFALLVAAVLFVLLEEWSARHHAKTAIGLL
jgi:hypothetical protein